MGFSDITLTKLNEVYFRVTAEPHILQEMSDAFTFKVPGAHFHPSVKAKIWDGRIRLLNRQNNTIYIGLIDKILEFAQDREYGVDYPSLYIQREYDENVVAKWIEERHLPFEITDYQYAAFLNGAQRHRSLILSPTGSGKSLIIYLLTRHFIDWDEYTIDSLKERQILIIVPTVNLVAQLHANFLDYAKDDPTFTENNLHKIYSGQDKDTKAQCVISTWQSLFRLPKEFFEQFGMVMVDEAHLAKADSLKSILTKCTKANYRYGTTGTLDGSKCNSMVIEGLTGPVFKASTTKKLMEQNRLADLKINCVVLKHKEENAKAIRKFSYADEIEFIISEPKRNKFVRNLAISLKGNTLVLFVRVKQHGLVLYTDIQNKLKEMGNTTRKVFFIHGGTDIEDRENVRNITEQEPDAIIVASSGVFSTGIDIKNLENVVFASPSKSRIRTLQSIGRALRIGRSDKASLYDIVDDLSYKKHKNFALRHFIDRVQIYDEEQFDYSLFQITL